MHPLHHPHPPSQRLAAARRATSPRRCRRPAVVAAGPDDRVALPRRPMLGQSRSGGRAPPTGPPRPGAVDARCSAPVGASGPVPVAHDRHPPGDRIAPRSTASGASPPPARSSIWPGSGSARTASKRPSTVPFAPVATSPLVLERRLAALRSSGQWGVRLLDRLLVDTGGHTDARAALPRARYARPACPGRSHRSSSSGTVGPTPASTSTSSPTPSWSRSRAARATARQPSGPATRNVATSCRTPASGCSSTPGMTSPNGPRMSPRP